MEPKKNNKEEEESDHTAALNDSFFFLSRSLGDILLRSVRSVLSWQCLFERYTIYRQAYYMVLDTGYLLSSASVYKWIVYSAYRDCTSFFYGATTDRERYVKYTLRTKRFWPCVYLYAKLSDSNTNAGDKNCKLNASILRQAKYAVLMIRRHFFFSFFAFVVRESGQNIP